MTDIVAARTGTPLNVTYSRSSSSVATGYTTNQRPNLVPGVSLTPPGGKRIQWNNRELDQPRGLYRGSGLQATATRRATSLAARACGKPISGSPSAFRSAERAQLQFRCETFNLFNRAQYSLPLEEIWLPATSTAPASIEPQVSTASTTPIGTGTPREIQFALRLEF